MNAPVMFQRMAAQLLGDLDFVRVYIDDVFIHSKWMAEHTVHVTVVCKRIQWAIKLKLWKCFFAKKEVELHEYGMSCEGIKADDSKSKRSRTREIPGQKRNFDRS